MNDQAEVLNQEDPISLAVAIAAGAHENQVDLTDQPYIFHPLRVMEAVRAAGYDQYHIITAVLHDTVEDTPLTVAQIERLFGGTVAQGVEALTRREDETTYHSFILRVRANSIARIVKHFDIIDNLNRIRGLEEVDPEKAQRLQRRYKSALRNLVE